MSVIIICLETIFYSADCYSQKEIVRILFTMRVCRHRSGLLQIEWAVLVERHCANCIGGANYSEAPGASFSL